MGKFKLGLQKEVSKIFTGITVPGKKSTDQSGVEQTKTSAPDSLIPNQPVQQDHHGDSPVTHTPLVQKPSSVSPLPKVVTPPPAEATHSQEVVMSPPVEATHSQEVVMPPPAAAAHSQQVVIPPPAAVLPQSGDHYTESVVSAKPAAQMQRPFTIPEPPVSKTPAVKSPVYEPPARKQAIYEPPPRSVPLAETSAKQQKVEIISTAPAWQTSLLKILRPITDKFLTPQPGISPLRQKVTLVIFVILPLVSIFILAKYFTKPAKAGAKSAKTSVAVAVNNQINWQLPPPLSDNFRDPMVFGSSGQNQQEEAGPVVKGIVYSEDNPCAVVGERIVSAGDTVNGATVVKINPDSVEFSAGDKKWSQKVER